MTYINKIRTLYRLISPGTHLPIYVLLYVTHRCDAKCGHCFFWRELNSDKQKELSHEEIDKLAKSIGPVLQVTLTGGSPELRKDLPSLAQSFYKHCKPPNMTICMNGYHTERISAHVEEILKTCPDQQLTIGLSLDGIGEEHDKIRGINGLFDCVVNTFDRLNKLKKKYPKLKLAVATVVSGLNYRAAEKTALWAKENLPVDMLKPILVRGQPRDPHALGGSYINTYLKIVNNDTDQLMASYKTNDPFHRLATITKEKIQRDMIGNIFKTGKSPVICSASRENIVIHAKGDVMGCELRPDKLDNLRDYNMNVSKLWYTAKAKNFRSVIRDEKCYCYHHCFLAPAIFRSPNQWPNILRTAWRIWKSRTP